MKKYVNGEYIEMTQEEITAVENRQMLAQIQDSRRPMTAEEVSRVLITQQINTLTVDDNTALRMREFYPEWVENMAYGAGFKVQRNGKLWRVTQAHTALTGWEPENAPALWERINETHTGALEDPIPYEGNLVLESGKHYMQDQGLYRCIRDTGSPVYHDLEALTGIYLEKVW